MSSENAVGYLPRITGRLAFSVQSQCIFKLQRKILSEFGTITGLDPWFFSCLDEVVHSINVYEKVDLEDLSDKASGLFSKNSKQIF